MSTVEKLEHEYASHELENLSNNIFKKIALLNITLPELAKMIGMEYQTLWRIAYKKNDYMPNLRVLFPIANFFDVTIADLLKNPNIPQYVPVINFRDVHSYLLPKTQVKIGEYEKILCNEYVHEYAFALEIKSNYLERVMPIKYIFKPYNKITVGGHILFRYNNHSDFFVRVSGVNNETTQGINMLDNDILEFKITNLEVLAIAVKQIMDNDLI